jgi:hypothetical protein
MDGNGKNGRSLRTAHHPDENKVNLVNRLRRIEGQIRGIALPFTRK